MGEEGGFTHALPSGAPRCPRVAGLPPAPPCPSPPPPGARSPPRTAPTRDTPNPRTPRWRPTPPFPTFFPVSSCSPFLPRGRPGAHACPPPRPHSPRRRSIRRARPPPAPAAGLPRGGRRAWAGGTARPPGPAAGGSEGEPGRAARAGFVNAGSSPELLVNGGSVEDGREGGIYCCPLASLALPLSLCRSPSRSWSS